MREIFTQFLIPPSGSFVVAAAAGAMLGSALLWFSRRWQNDLSIHPENASSVFPSGAAFPRTYRVSLGWKIGISFLMGILALAAFGGAWGFGVIGSSTRDSTQGLVLVLLLVSVGAGAILYFVDNLKSSLVLHADRLEIHELWRVRCIRRDDIQTRQVIHPPNSPAVLVLRLKSSQGRIKLPLMWATDSAWTSWFSDIPDFDVEETKSFEASVSENPELGATVEDRQQRLARARNFARAAIWANVGLVAWAFLYPRPYDLLVVVLIALPWIVIWVIAQAPGIYAFNAPRGSGQPDLTVLVISPGFLLTLRAITDVHILDWQRQMLWAVIVTAALITAILWSLPAARKKPGSIALTGILLLSYGYGASVASDALFDGSSPTRYTARVYGKHVSSGRSRTPELQLGAWGPETSGSTVAVPWDLYRNIKVGEIVCVELHSGALGVPWYRAAQCPQQQ